MIKRFSDSIQVLIAVWIMLTPHITLALIVVTAFASAVRVVQWAFDR